VIAAASDVQIMLDASIVAFAILGGCIAASSAAVGFLAVAFKASDDRVGALINRAIGYGGLFGFFSGASAFVLVVTRVVEGR